MKRLIAALALLAFAGAGCPMSGPKADAPKGPAMYTNAQYGFAFDYPSNMDVHERADDVRQTTYVGLKADFFASVRDTVKEEKPVNIFAMYALPKTSTDDFVKALEKSGPGIKETGRAPIEKGGIAMTEVTSTTEFGEDKENVLFDRGDSTVVLSVFIGQKDTFATLLDTFRAVAP